MAAYSFSFLGKVVRVLFLRVGAVVRLGVGMEVRTVRMGDRMEVAAVHRRSLLWEPLEYRKFCFLFDMVY